MLHKDQFDNSRVVIKDVISGSRVLRQPLYFRLMNCLDPIHDDFWIKQIKSLNNSLSFDEEKVSAAFKVHEPVPWDNCDGIKDKRSFKDIVLSDRTQIHRCSVFLHILVLNEKSRNQNHKKETFTC